VKIDARTIATQIAIGIVTAIIVEWLLHRTPTLRALIDDRAGHRVQNPAFPPRCPHGAITLGSKSGSK
jgi:hypothetical protein